MTRKTIATWGILVVLLISIVGTAYGQTGTDPEVTPSPVPTEQAGAKFFTHPVVQILSAYFDREKAEVTPTVDPNATPTVEPTSESGLGPIGEEIAAYHEEGMGFGVLVKLYAMAEASKAACEAEAVTPAEGTDPTAPTCTPVTADELVAAFKGGAGMGALFKEYGKPNLLGVGHVKQELKKQAAEATLEPGDDTTTTKDKGKPEKGKPEKAPKAPKQPKK